MGGFSIPGSTGSNSSTNSTSGLGQGIDVQGTVSALIDAQRGPENIWKQQQKTEATQQQDLVQINGQLSALLTALQSLTGPTGALTSVNVSSSNSAIVSAVAGSSASAGTHLIQVSNLATASSYYTAPVASGTILSGGFSIQVGSGAAQPITIDSSNNTLSTLASYINSKNLGVTANVITDANGSRLALISQSSGSAGAITISGNTTSLSFNQADPGANASLTVDGVPVSSSSNTVSGVIPGITLNLNGAAPGSTVTLNVSSDTSAVQSALSQFVSAYNAVIGQINTEFSYNASTQTAGNLFGDSGLGVVQAQLLGDVTLGAGGSGPIQSLADLGISENDDGTLTLNSGKLQTALTNNYSDVQNFLQSTASGSFSKQLTTDLTNLTDPVNGVLYQKISGLQSQQSDLQTQINDFEANLAIKQQQLLIEYNKLNVTLQQMPLLEKQTQQQLASLSGGG